MVYVGFSRNRFPISFLIRHWTKSQVRHSFLLFDDETLNTKMVLEVTLGGYRIIPWSTFKRKNTVVSIKDVEIDLLPGLRATTRWLGLPFDFKAFLAFWRLFKNWSQHPFTASPKALICSEVVVHVLQIVDLPGSKELKPKATSPQALLDFLADYREVSID